MTNTYDGFTYQGEFENGNFQGRGVMTFTDGSKYDGQWLNSEKSGPGIYTGIYDSEEFTIVGEFAKNEILNGEKLDENGFVTGRFVAGELITKSYAYSNYNPKGMWMKESFHDNCSYFFFDKEELLHVLHLHSYLLLFRNKI